MPKEVWWGRAEIAAAGPVFDLLRRLIDGYGHHRSLMPLVVLQAAEEDGSGFLDRRVTQIVDFVHQAHRPRRLMAKRLDGGGGADAYASAIAMLRELSEHSWENRGQSQYKPFDFPRSRLLSAIEQAAPEVSGGDSGDGLNTAERRERLLRRLAELRWRPGSGPDDQRPSGWLDSVGAVVNPSGFVGALFIACLSVLLGEGGLKTALWGGLLALVAFMVVRVVASKAPPLLWLRQASAWFATTTFLAPSGNQPLAAEWSRWRPAKSWETIQDRACAVAEQVVAAAAGDTTSRQFHLELRALALLEDLRHNFRPRAADMRHRKRTVPPVVYFPNATEDNGGMLLLRTISNVRSRRSEVDPLLALAAVPAAEPLRPLAPGEPDPSRPTSPDGDRSAGPDARYQQWVNNLSVGQSPSRAVALPWILWIPLPTDQLRGSHSVQHTTARIRHTAAWVLWSRVCLAFLLAIALGLGFLGNQWMADRYCQGRLIGSNTDSVRVGDECVGVATGDVWLAGGNDLELYGAGKGVTFDAVEQAIRRENADIGPKNKYVTIVYAGPVTSAEKKNTRKGLEEITGVYLYQHYNNNLSDQPVKIRVLLANGGQGMQQVIPMARHIATLAKRDPSIVGVVGMGRDTTESEEAVRILKGAGLPVVGTTNSGSHLARNLSNWFGLAATDEEEAHDVLSVLAEQLAEENPGARSVILSRKVGSDKDLYTTEQARVGEEMLAEAGFTLLDGEEYSLSNGEPELTGPVGEICAADPVPVALYFAGRVEDVPNLMAQLSDTPGCAGEEITVFTGDDLAKGNYDEDIRIAQKVTLYHVSLAPMGLAYKENPTSFYEEAHEALTALLPTGMRPSALSPAQPYDDPLFSSGQVVLAYSATAVLYRASKNGDDPQTAPETWADLRRHENPNLPTGTISFQDSQPYDDQKGHGYEIIKVTYSGNKSQSDSVCGRLAGSDDVLKAAQCPLG